MLQQPSLETPKIGRSRFSKALPSVPPMDDHRAPLPTPPKDIPKLSDHPIFRPRGDSLGAAQPSPVPKNPLPPLPVPKDTPAHTTANGPPTMVLSRKPVARKPVPSAASTKTQSSARSSASTPSTATVTDDKSSYKPITLVDAPMTWEAPAVEQPPAVSVQAPAPTTHTSAPAAQAAPPQSPDKPATDAPTRPKTMDCLDALPANPLLLSPSESLSSILSAYSRSSDGSIDGGDLDLLRSSDGSGSMPDSELNFSPKNSALPPVPIHNTSAPLPSAADSPNPAQTKPLPRKPVQNRALPPPPPPSKDPQPQSTPSQPTRAGASETTNASPDSPQSQQLWRRRSMKSSRELPNLQLNHSHGSTASSHSAASSQPPPPPPKSNQDSKTPAFSSSTDRNAANAADKMGHGGSKISSMLHKNAPPSKDQDSSSMVSERTARPAANRPPTPEYQKQDVKTPVPDTFISPISPASSPEPSAQAPTRNTKDLPPQPVAHERNEIKPSPAAATPEHPHNGGPARGIPNLKVKTSMSSMSEQYGPRPGADFSRSGTPVNDFGSPRMRNSGESARFSARDMSARSGVPPRMSADADPRLVRTDSRGTMYKGRDGTLYPKMKASDEPDPRAFSFPQQPSDALRNDAIIKAVPLKSSHYNCFQKHRVMKRLPNKRSALACQTCEREDKEDRWACSFCHLRICESCVRRFDGHKRDLSLMMDDLRANSTMGLSSPSRPGSGLGLEFTSQA